MKKTKRRPKKNQFNGHHTTTHGKAGKRLRKQGCIVGPKKKPEGDPRYAGERRVYIRVCPECQTPYSSFRSDASTCGPTCRQKRSRRHRQQSGRESVTRAKVGRKVR